jgi:hypothetical protein
MATAALPGLLELAEELSPELVPWEGYEQQVASPGRGFWSLANQTCGRRGQASPSVDNGALHEWPPSQHCPGSGAALTLILALSFSRMSWMYPTGLHRTSKPISASPTVLAVTRLGVGE